MEKSLKELALLLNGTVENGDPEFKITGVNGLMEAGEQDISFAVQPYVEQCHLSKAGAIIIAQDEQAIAKPTLRVADPRAAFAALLEVFRAREELERTISPMAVISEKAKIGKNVAIEAFVMIEDGAEIGDNCSIYSHTYIGRHVKVGNDCIFYPNVTVREDCVINNRVILQSGCVIGGDGFGYLTDKNTGKHSKVLQAGNVVLEDDVEIGSNSCIDRATAGSTIVGAGTKIDNLVHLGHNDVLGKNCLVVAHVGISGSVTVGDNVTFAGQVGTVGHISIGSNCVFAGKAGIIGNVPDNSLYAGFPARPHKEWLRQEANMRKVGDLVSKVKQLEKALAELQK